MAHSDEHGLVLPPKLAPVHVVIVPIYKNIDQLSVISEKAERIKKLLSDKGFTVKYDDRDTQKPGWKFAEYELKGIPVRLAIGPKDIENNTVELARRDTLQKQTYPQEGIEKEIVKLLDEIQSNIFKKALDFREKNTYRTDDYEEFKNIMEDKGGFVLAHWDGTEKTELRIKDDTMATIRCILLDGEQDDGKCILTGKPSRQRVLFAKAY